MRIRGLLIVFLFIAIALSSACNETNVSTGVDGDADDFADSDTDRDSEQPDGDSDQAETDGDSEIAEGDGDSDSDSACTPDDYRCREAVLERCSLAGEWGFYRDCALSGMECAAGDCIQSPDGDSEAEPDMEETDGDGFEETEDAEGDLPESEVEADSEPESEGWDIDPDDVVIGEECPEQGISICYHQTIVACRFDLVWVKGVQCTDDDNYCWQGECIDSENTPDYPGCIHGDSYCSGNIIHACNFNNEWVTGVDCSDDGNICVFGECVHE